jgi:hypothetical protein
MQAMLGQIDECEAVRPGIASLFDEPQSARVPVSARLAGLVPAIIYWR